MSTRAEAQSPRAVVVNAKRLDEKLLSALERQYGVTIQDGDYWYDQLSGAWGVRGGPALGLIAAGLALGGPLQPDASNGNTGVFINGRELHPLDLQVLQQLTPVTPGRYWVDAYGNAGYEGGPPLVNLWALARARGGNGAYSAYTRSGAMVGNDGNGCLVFNDPSTHTSYSGSGC